MNSSISRSGIRFITGLLTLIFCIGFNPVSSFTQSNCDYANDIDYSVTMAGTTLSVHGDLCYTSDDKLVVTCIDNFNTPSRDTFTFVECNPAPPANDQRFVNISTFTFDIDINECEAVEILFPDGTVGYYYVDQDESYLENEYCEDECLIFSVVDAWGGLIGTTSNVPCCIDGEIAFVPNCFECEEILGGVCFPTDCGNDIYASVDFGCVEIDRSSTRTFYVTACPFVGNDNNIEGRNGGSELLTGNIDCHYPYVEDIPWERGNDDNVRDALVAVDHCEIIIYDIQVNSEHLDDMIVMNGAHEMPFSLVGDFEFPITLKRGDNLPFDIKYAPYYDELSEAVVTICYELSDECECGYAPEPTRNSDNSRDGMHCETTKWYDFIVTGSGEFCYDDVNRDAECTLKCPECIFTPDALETNGAGGDGPCGGYFEYVIGYAGPDAPPSPDPPARNSFYCGDLSLNTVTGQLFIFDEGIYGNPERVPGEGEWIPTSPAPYGIEYYELECSDELRADDELPYIPYLFFDDEDSEMYLVSGFGQPVEQVDIIVSLDFTGLERNGGYVGCGDYEPGDIFYIHPDVADAKQNAVEDPIAYEFIACDGYRLFAKLVDEMVEPYLSCSFYAEFPSTYTMGYYGPYLNGGRNQENGCYAWVRDYCALTRTELLVVHNEADEGYDELICNVYGMPLRQPEEICHPYADFGCILQGNTVQQSFDLFHCSDYRFFDVDRNQDNTREDEMNIDCDYFLFEDEIIFGQGCEITIHSIDILEYSEDEEMMRNGYLPSEHFSLAQPMTFPLTISFEEFEEMLIDFTPTETGFHEAKVKICYENTCSPCFDDPRRETSREAEDGECYFEQFVFYLEGCSYELSNMDEDLDGDLEVVDPCSCGDPQNVYGNPGGTISLFHDFISVGGPNIDDTYDIEVEITQGELYDENNVALPRLGDNNRIQLNWDPVLGTHFLEFWTEPGVGFGGIIYVNGTPSTDPDAMLLSICDGPCAPIPTIGEWGVIILSMMLLIFGLIGLRQPKLQPQVVKK